METWKPKFITDRYDAAVFSISLRLIFMASPEEKKIAARARKNAARRAKDQAMRDCGLIKVRGALGGVYWE